MMAVMMAPTVWPWVRSFHHFSDHSSPWATAEFAGGYLSAWVGYSAIAAALQLALAGTVSRWLAAGLFASAGIYQFAPLKRSCLTHCRNPLTYFLSRWRNGPAAGFRMGLHHGLFCIGCCWATMATMLLVGVSSAAWMVLLAALAFVEQVLPFGHRARVPIGLAFCAAAALRLLR